MTMSVEAQSVSVALILETVYFYDSLQCTVHIAAFVHFDVFVYDVGQLVSALII